MNKLTLLFIAATLIACGAKDEDEDASGRTTDPFIGTWYTEIETGNATLVVNSNGGWIVNGEIDGEIETDSGTWENNGNDFDAVRQIYNFTYDNGEPPQTVTVQFSSDFNSFSIGDFSYTRQ